MDVILLLQVDVYIYCTLAIDSQVPILYILKIIKGSPMKLANYMIKNKLNDVAFAAQLQMTRTTVSRFRRNKTKPSRQAIIQIEKVTNGAVKFKDWLS